MWQGRPAKRRRKAKPERRRCETMPIFFSSVIVRISFDVTSFCRIRIPPRVAIVFHRRACHSAPRVVLFFFLSKSPAVLLLIILRRRPPSRFFLLHLTSPPLGPAFVAFWQKLTRSFFFVGAEVRFMYVWSEGCAASPLERFSEVGCRLRTGKRPCAGNTCV